MLNAIWSLIKKAGRAVVAVFRPVTNLIIHVASAPVVSAAAGAVAALATAEALLPPPVGLRHVGAIAFAILAVPMTFAVFFTISLIAILLGAAIQFVSDVLDIPFALASVAVGDSPEPEPSLGDPFSTTPIHA